MTRALDVMWIVAFLIGLNALLGYLSAGKMSKEMLVENEAHTDGKAGVPLSNSKQKSM